MNDRDPLGAARRLPSGARFFKCALQVNPLEYLKRHRKPSSYPDEAAYNAAVVEACREHGVEALAVMDHYRIRTSATLVEAARAAGIRVFPGFEAVTKDGVHLLCLFSPGTKLQEVDRRIGECGIENDDEGSRIGKYDAIEFLDQSRQWGAICIAAHVASKGGLLKQLSGKPRIEAWCSPHLLACSLPGSVRDAPDDLRPILANKNAEYRRQRALAIVNAQDVDGPEQFAKPGVSCRIRMSEVTVEGLRQAFLARSSRIRLHSDPDPEQHAELVAVAWEGGFLDGVAIHLNADLNALIGGRGAGKSTVIESLRYVLGLEAVGEEARRAHEGIVRRVLRSGTKVSLLARSHHPAEREYRIERTVPNPPIVRDDAGELSNLLPTEILPGVEVYGQHEISELTRSPEKLTRLLDRFAARDPALERRKAELRRELEKTRRSILDVRKELGQIEERLAALPGLEETLERYRAAGLEAKLREQSLLVREELVLGSIPERLQPFRDGLENLRQELPIDRVFLSPKALEDLPGRDILAAADPVLERLSGDLEVAAGQLAEALGRADAGIAAVRARWDERKRGVEAGYQQILRELQKSAVEGEEFIQLRREIEGLRPLRERRVLLQRVEAEHRERRRGLAAEWEDLKAEAFRHLSSAAKTVSRKLRDRVQVEVSAAGDREPLFQLLREGVGGRLSEAIERLAVAEDFSLPGFVAHCGQGPEALQTKYEIPRAQAKRLVEADPELWMRIEELELPATTAIRLNTAPSGQLPSWQALDQLSTGQKATAVLLLLLLESDAPLIVDQPEDDLDNRFITEGVVPMVREEKRRRQFLFSTHNANIPVLGDAELILGLTASGEAEGGHARLAPEHMGSIDAQPVRVLVEEILEGGKEAFEERRLKYGF